MAGLFDVNRYFSGKSFGGGGGVKWEGPDATGDPWTDARGAMPRFRPTGRAIDPDPFGTKKWPGPKWPPASPLPVPPTSPQADPNGVPQLPYPPRPPGQRPRPIPPEQLPSPNSVPIPGPTRPGPMPPQQVPPTSPNSEPGPYGQRPQQPGPVPSPIPPPSSSPLPPDTQMQPLDPMLLYGLLAYLAQHPATQGLGQLGQYRTPQVSQALQSIRGMLPGSWMPQLRAQFMGSPYQGLFGDEGVKAPMA